MANVTPENSVAQPKVDAKGHTTSARLALIHSLEELRQRLHREINDLEAAVHERAQERAKLLHDRAAQLEQRANDLEHAHVHITNESDRWESERQSMIAQIEKDRRLLAEAWERLEREQVKSFGGVQTAARPATVAAPSEAPAPRPVTHSPSPASDRPVAEEVLKQFQSLKRDVRRNAAASYAV